MQVKVLTGLPIQAITIEDLSPNEFARLVGSLRDLPQSMSSLASRLLTDRGPRASFHSYDIGIHQRVGLGRRAAAAGQHETGGYYIPASRGTNQPASIPMCEVS